jgi:hypothetical protein
MAPSRCIRSRAAWLAAVALLCCNRGSSRSEPDSSVAHDSGTTTSESLPNRPEPAAGHGSFHVGLASSGDTQFTTAEGENRIRLRAQLPPGFETAQVIWQVEQGIGGTWTSVSVAQGKETQISVVTPPGPTRFQGSHPNTAQLRAAQLQRERINYRVSATAQLGERSLASDTLQIQQSMLAAIRQEYYDLGLRRGAPPLTWFKETVQLPQGPPYGDFDMAVVEPKFMERLNQLEEVWRNDYGLRWQLNGLFRNPVHNRFHVVGGGSGPVSNSWHQFGCAADLQTYPALGGGTAPRQDSLNARQFWDALAQEARQLDFDVEPRDKNPSRPAASFSGVGHVHIETDCIQ